MSKNTLAARERRVLKKAARGLFDCLLRTSPAGDPIPDDPADSWWSVLTEEEAEGAPSTEEADQIAARLAESAAYSWSAGPRRRRMTPKFRPASRRRNDRSKGG